jgi:hypothetical protein
MLSTVTRYVIRLVAKYGNKSIARSAERDAAIAAKHETRLFIERLPRRTIIATLRARPVFMSDADCALPVGVQET